jgi:hypothetical protein
MIDRIYEAMIDAYSTIGEDFSDFSKKGFRRALIEFMMEKGEDSVIALYGFIRYAQTKMKGQDISDAIVSTVFHDVGGRYDKHMLPRSSSYTEYAKK